MRIDPDYLREHYASLSDDALREIDRNDLVVVARGFYDEECARRRLKPAEQAGSEAPPDQTDQQPSETSEPDNGTPPNWLDGAACVGTFTAEGRRNQADLAADAVETLRVAGIPSYVAFEEEPAERDPQPRLIYRVLVPGAFNLEAASVLDTELFNPRLECEWKEHLETLSDEEIRSLNSEAIYAGMLDRLERLKRVYEQELIRRKIMPSAVHPEKFHPPPR